MTASIDIYQSGKLVDNLGNMATQIDESILVIFATSRSGDNEASQTFHIGGGNGEGSASATVSGGDFKPEEYAVKLYGGLTDEKTLDDEEIVLATIAYSNNDSALNSKSNQFFENPKGHMDELSEYDLVYIFKVAFMK